MSENTTGRQSPNKGKSLNTFKDVQIRYMSEGVKSVRELHNTLEGGLSKAILRNAIKKMPPTTDTTALNAFAVELYGEQGSNAGRGRTAPTIGTRRQYLVQQVKNTGPFLRLPLDTLNTSKGDEINVSFEDGRIVVSAA